MPVSVALALPVPVTLNRRHRTPSQAASAIGTDRRASASLSGTVTALGSLH